MMETRTEFQNELRAVLALELDPFMAGHDFARRKNSIQYVRRFPDCKQVLRVDVDIRPKYHAGARARIYPWLELRFPEVNRIALEMVGGQHPMISSGDITVSQPMEIVVPKECHVRWFLYQGAMDIVLCVRSIQGYIEKWVMPFLNECHTVDEFTKFYEANDERVLKSQELNIRTAAAYVVLGQPTKALQVLESKLGKAGPRREYAKAFEYVQSRIT